MIIAQISDTHIDPDHENASARLKDLEACIDDINALDPLPDVVIHTGDMAHNGDDEKYQQAKNILSGLEPRLLVCSGNRDDRALLRQYFDIGTDLMPGTHFLHYAVEDFPVRLLIVDTISDTVNQGDYCQNRADALAAALRDKPETPTALFMHHPPFEVTESKFPHQFNPWDGVARMESALEGQHHVVGIFCGHSHRNTSGEIAGIQVSSTPSTAIDLRLGDYGDENVEVPLYKLIRLDGDAAPVSEIRAARPESRTQLSDAAAD